MTWNHTPDFEDRLEAAVQRRLSEIKRKRPQEKGPDSDHGKLKSPSDSDLYQPAVRRQLLKTGVNSPPVGLSKNSDGDSRVEEILKYLKRARLDVSENSDLETMRQGPRGEENNADAEDGHEDNGRQQPEIEQARLQAEKAILEAEKYKAALTPKGRSKTLDQDDEFFHITCHVESALREKCEKGEFVELEKLLPKLKLTGRNRVESKYDQKFELVTKEGQAFVVPSSDKDAKVTNIRKWEQAFRIYAALYSQVNPDRAAEIWQYVHVVNTAASSFVWENVACYDMTFRHLMAANPSRSWAKIYTQGWSLAMRDPIPMTKYGGAFQHATPRGGNKAGWKDGYCWRYNKNKCKFGDKCRFEHKCSGCGGLHPYSTCPKRGNKKSAEKPSGEEAAGKSV